jgi:hypothetical protein
VVKQVLSGKSVRGYGEPDPFHRLSAFSKRSIFRVCWRRPKVERVRWLKSWEFQERPYRKKSKNWRSKYERWLPVLVLP